MSGGFELQPLDGGPRLALAPGETVIGRGPLLGITDKRVSRRHAILEVVDGKLRIKPLHRNPCYYQSSEKSQLLPLKTNIWCWLNPGDRFSLLVDKYIFCVLSTHSEMEMEYTLRNSQMLDEDDILNETPNSSSVDLPDKTPSAPQLERSTETAKTQTTANNVSFIGESRDLSKQQLDPSERKRILPAWMLTENSNDKNLSVISGDNNVTQESEQERVYKDKTQVNITQQGKKRLISSGGSENTSAEEDTGKKCKNDDQEESVISSKEMPQSFSAATLHNTEVINTKTNSQRSEIPVEALGKVSEHKIVTKGSSDEDSMARSCSESCSSTQRKSFCDKPQKSHPDSSSDPPNPECVQAEATDSVPCGSEENKVQRTSCMYGANCYSLNATASVHAMIPLELVNNLPSLHTFPQNSSVSKGWIS
ncbi:aprataxin and PNK-like factor isoform X3 [Moschus berezovskii]|uniref:aprataxin and PNK-like factor isoform X3 n=1 Tax=Moschus berezovskii TaxID=68408 RepID=UPI002443830C|nr:aprataxin and PNK-like factor isoform X3 [Moschus berezovskii]